MLVCIEGISNSGKTTLLSRIISTCGDVFDLYDSDNLIHKNISRITSPLENEKILDKRTELFLYMALLSDKAKLINSSNRCFIVDRFSLSIFSYFSTKYSMDPCVLDGLLSCASDNIIPDLTIFLDVPLNVIFERAKDSPLSRKDIGLSEYYYSMRLSFLNNLERYSRDYLIIDGTEPAEIIANKACNKIHELLNK